MASITQVSSYIQIAAETASDITAGWQNWTAFLKTASKLYRYQFTDLLLIHAQNPDATACAEFDTYKKMCWYVRRGSKGIALVDVKNGQRPDLRYVFDISDTGRKQNSYNLYLWKYKEEHQDIVTKALEKRYDVSGKEGIVMQLAHIATQIVKAYWEDYKQEIRCEAEGSLLEKLDNHNLRVRFCDMAAYSIIYTVFLRCSLHPERYLSNDIFGGITDFNTQRIIKTLGYVVSQASEEILHLIAVTIITYERKKQSGNRTDSQRKPHGDTKHKDENKKQPSSFIISVDNSAVKDSQQSAKPTLKEIYEKYKPVVRDFLLKDKAYKNACRNSDKENAILEGIEAVKRAALSIEDLAFMKLYFDIMEFHNRMQKEVLDETYSKLATEPEPDPPAAKPVKDADTEPDAAELEQEEITKDHTDPDPAVADQEDSPAAEPEPDTPDAQPAPNPDVESPPQPAIIIDESEVEELPPAHTASNYRITDDHLGEVGPKDKYTFNMYAIIMLKQIESENRAATPGEQDVLAHYVGWGGISDVFDAEKAGWEKEYQELQSYLTPEEYASARSSVLNAHYTSPVIIRAMYAALYNMGFRSGNVLEPSCGIGNFFGCIPEEMSKSKLYGVEIDIISGRIAKLLYPKARIIVCGFENTDFPSNFFDLVIGNVPFGQYKVNDQKYNRFNFTIHNYFLAKSLDLVRPGGILAFITSRYTFDAQNTDVRSYLAERADLLGAVRLPRNAFRANAGTDVVSDIIFLQKRDTPALEMSEWVQTEENEDGFPVNSYFLSHPDMVLGTPSSRSTQYGSEYTVLPLAGADLGEQLREAVSHIHGKYQSAIVHNDSRSSTKEDIIPADPNVKNYSYTLVDGKVYYRENSVMKKAALNATAKSRVVGMIVLRDCVHQLINLQLDECVSDDEIKAKQDALNRLYDAYTHKYGLINDRANRLAFDKDSSYYLLCSLEILDENGKLERKADMFYKRTIKQHKSVTHVDTASEALVVSIGERACVDIAFMSQITGKSESELTKDLHGVIYKDPVKNTWQTADEYLSGNVRKKLRQAKAAAEQNPDYQINVEALQKAQPKDLDASEIEVRIGATWIDKSYIQQFMTEILKTPVNLRNKIRVNYSSATAQWFISNKNAINYNDVAAYTTYGTDRANAYRILEESLNLRDIRIYDTIEDEDGKEKRVLNAKQTTLASQKQQALRDAFRDWIFQDPERRQVLVHQYNELMNSSRPREYDGSHIVFSGINPAIQLRPHQLNAIAHILYGGNTLLAHQVGAGKTFEVVAAAMESKRLGLCSKSLIVVPNHLTEQWASEFLRLYPSANILVAAKKDFETANRKKFCARIAASDVDAVIIGHSQFEKIPVSYERQEQLIQGQISEITNGIIEVKAAGGERFTIKQLEITKKNLEAQLEKLQANHRKDSVITFEQLGVDRLFVDEAQAYKNLYLYTKMRNVAGLSSASSQKSSDMFAKCQYIDQITGGRGIVFATGTPISNSMTEMYTMMRYLQYKRLKELGMLHFDNWASSFGETITALELAPEGTGYRARTRFAKFFNLPELMSIFKETADVKTAGQLDLKVPHAEYHNIVSQPSKHQREMVKELSKRAEMVHKGIDSRIDNMLKITSDGRKIGLDQRIINPMLPDDPDSKVNACVGNVYRIWEEYSDIKASQLIFCDISIPKNDGTFNIYDDIREKLVQRGIPAGQIAFIHQADTDLQKKELFSKVRLGQVRVLIGSTQKMGTGTNVQERLIALHDLDCPWRPADLEQRAGRIIRQGNMNQKVLIFRYVTEGTFDAYLWQTIEAKQKFISQIMTSKSPVRSCEDVDETVLSFAEIKALCAGDPRIKERMNLELEVSRLRIMKADHQSKLYRMEDDVMKHYPEQIKEVQGFITGMENDIQTLKQNVRPDGEFAGMVINGITYTDKEKAGTALIDACQDISRKEPVEIGSYLGFSMSVKFSGFEHKIIIKGAVSYQVELGGDIFGNITRINNALGKIDAQLAAYKTKLENLQQQMDAAKAEINKPYQYEDELTQKSARLAELDAALNIGVPEPQTAA